MGKLVIMTFTTRGYALAKFIAEKLEGRRQIEFHKVSKLGELMPQSFKQGNALIFIGAAGIAVRAIAPYLRGKTTDPAVIVIDEGCKFVIPILSGHIGGANALAAELAELLDATAVITTSTDVNKVFAVDTFAAQNGYYIANPDRIKDISSALLEGNEVGLATELEIVGALPPNIKLEKRGGVGISIAGNVPDEGPFGKTLHLLPKSLHVGIGCRKNTEFGKLDEFFLSVIRQEGIDIRCVGSISSIELKKDEPAICELSAKYGIPFITYSADELADCENLFSGSDFVKKTTGAGSVCEASAYLASKKGQIIRGKTANKGITIAIAKEDRRVIFENTNGRD